MVKYLKLFPETGNETRMPLIVTLSSHCVWYPRQCKKERKKKDLRIDTLHTQAFKNPKELINKLELRNEFSKLLDKILTKSNIFLRKQWVIVIATKEIKR